MERSSAFFRTLLPLVLFLPVTAPAFEIDSEYRSIATERGYAGLLESLSPKPLDSEYQSDILTYSESPFSLLASSDISPGNFAAGQERVAGIFSTSAGSLSATQFDFRLRAKFARALSDSLRFVYLRSEHENYEEQASASFVELQYQIAGSRLWLAAYGSLARMKREDDVGFAAIWRDPSEVLRREHRLYVTFPDFTRSERNDAGDRFQSGPTVIGWKFESQNASGVYRSSEVRRESDVDWRDSASGIEYGTTMASFKRVTDRSSFRAQLDRKRIVKNTFDALGVVSAREGLIREREQLEYRRRTMTQELEGGVAWVARRWEDVVGRKLMHENLMFFFDWRPLPVLSDDPAMWRPQPGLELGLEATRFAKHGDVSLGSPTTRDLAWESRLNTRYRWVFSRNEETVAELAVALTFDLDRAEGGLFEGGHGQFLMRF